jgi:hypothetical protein
MYRLQVGWLRLRPSDLCASSQSGDWGRRFIQKGRLGQRSYRYNSLRVIFVINLGRSAFPLRCCSEPVSQTEAIASARCKIGKIEQL